MQSIANDVIPFVNSLAKNLNINPLFVSIGTVLFVLFVAYRMLSSFKYVICCFFDRSNSCQYLCTMDILTLGYPLVISKSKFIIPLSYVATVPPVCSFVCTFGFLILTFGSP